MREYSAMTNLARRAVILGLGVLLAACVSFSKDPPESLLSLSADAQVATGVAKSGQASESLLVERPEVPQKLETPRVPVDVDATSIAYVKDAVWVDKPAALFQKLLSETLAAQTGRLVLSDYEAAGQSRHRLTGTLVEFGVDATALEAVAIYDAAMIVRGEAIRKQRFEARIPIGAVEADPVGRGLNEAANRIAGEVVQWVGG